MKQFIRLLNFISILFPFSFRIFYLFSLDLKINTSPYIGSYLVWYHKMQFRVYFDRWWIKKTLFFSLVLFMIYVRLSFVLILYARDERIWMTSKRSLTSWNLWVRAICTIKLRSHKNDEIVFAFRKRKQQYRKYQNSKMDTIDFFTKWCKRRWELLQQKEKFHSEVSLSGWRTSIISLQRKNCEKKRMTALPLVSWMSA